MNEEVGERFDVLIVGAGLSGVCAAYHLQARSPQKSFAILEGRERIGGTWDLFRYPGIRSDSDMHTLGYSFRPWKEAKAIADGPAILKYIRDTAAEADIDGKIRFRHRVRRASWSTTAAQWTVEVECEGQRRFLTCGFLFMCSGYYRYTEGHTPAFVGRERFKGVIVHPQQWTDDIDYANKRVVVVGSGATAVTLVPAIAARATHVTMLQRSPTYIVSRPARDPIANGLRKILPARVAYGITRAKNVLLGMLFFKLSRRRPELIKKLIRKGVEKELGADYDIDTHFAPRYNPWDQRMCLVPDGDLFESLRGGKASIVTDQIESFTEQGIRLLSGRELHADLIVTATGLTLEVLGGAEIVVDDKPVDFSHTFNYRGAMFSDIPNLAAVFGYTNASWTLKADLICAYVCRLLNYMDKHGIRRCTPRNRDSALTAEPFLDFSSGYVLRALDNLPKQGSKVPWKLYQNYALDIVALKFGKLNDGVMEFT